MSIDQFNIPAPTDDELRRMVNGQGEGNVPLDVHWPAFEEGVTETAVDDYQSKLDLSRDEKIDIALWEAELAQPAKPEYVPSSPEASLEAIVNFAMPAAKNIIVVRRAFGKQE